MGQGLNAATGYNPQVDGFDFGKSLVSGVASSIVGQAVRGGKVNASTVATDAFGNMLSDSLAAANGQNTGGSSRNNGGEDALGRFIQQNEAFFRCRVFII